MSTTEEAAIAPAQGGPLQGLRVVEMAGMGPVPFCATWLSDMGADVVTVAPPVLRGPGMPLPVDQDPLWRGRPRMALDLKRIGDRERLLAMLDVADVLLEGFRPGVLERMGLAPDLLLQRRPRLVIGRMTGWGQDGPEAQVAGHDPNYLAITGALHSIGSAEGGPVPPLNLVGDFGGGAMFLCAGVLAAVMHARQSGRGQVVDASIVDGSLALMAPIYAMRAHGLWRDERASNLLDGGAPFARAYRTSDDRWMMTAAIEPQFYDALVKGLGLSAEALPDRYERANWPLIQQQFERAFAARSRSEWEFAFYGTDACVTPVLTLAEAPGHAHLAARGAFAMVEGHPIPVAAPRLSATPAAEVDRKREPLPRLLERWGVEPSPTSVLPP
jgi:alpha-methylacyl-CoA racemase